MLVREEYLMKNLKTIVVALYIFILTGLGYFITFLYGWGYNNYFSIPVHFIDLSILNITRSVTILGVCLTSYLAYAILFLGKTDLKSLLSPIRKLVFDSRLKFIFQFLCLIGSLIMVVSGARESISLFKFLYVFIGLGFCSLYFYLKGYSKASFTTFIVVLFMLPYILGLVNAKKQTDFFVVDDHPDYLIITFFADKMIGAKLDSESNTISPQFKTLPISILEESNNSINLVIINNLTIAEPKEFK